MVDGFARLACGLFTEAVYLETRMVLQSVMVDAIH